MITRRYEWARLVRQQGIYWTWNYAKKMLKNCGEIKKTLELFEINKIRKLKLRSVCQLL